MRRKSSHRNRPKHQHWVPQFYLSYFATPDTRDTDKPQVWIFSKDTADGDETLTSVRNVCGKRYLYTPKQMNGERCWDLDEKLNNVESLLGRVWRSVATGYVNLGEERIRKALALFIAVMHFRHPDVRQQVERIHRELLKFYETCPRLPDETPNIESMELNGKNYAIDRSDWHTYKNWKSDDHDRFFVDMVKSETGGMAQHLLEKRWSVVFSEWDTFVTTDKPVVVKHPTREKYGFGTPGSIISFPLSPTRLLVLDDLHHEPGNQYYPLEESKAGVLNFMTWQGASRFLVTGRPVATVLAELCAAVDVDDLA